MPRYLVERMFPTGLNLTQDAIGAGACREVIQNNAEHEVTWVHSYVTSDQKRSFCIYDGPNPESIRHAAVCNKLPVTQILEVGVLDPYFFRNQATHHG
jgi:Protein of unknown function (DUF4242)